MLTVDLFNFNFLLHPVFDDLQSKFLVFFFFPIDVLDKPTVEVEETEEKVEDPEEEVMEPNVRLLLGVLTSACRYSSRTYSCISCSISCSLSLFWEKNIPGIMVSKPLYT